MQDFKILEFQLVESYIYIVHNHSNILQALLTKNLLFIITCIQTKE